MQSLHTMSLHSRPLTFVMKPKRSALEIDVSVGVGRWPFLFPVKFQQ